MSFKLNIIGETGLQFFGKMSASNFHEINNVLAIINENAGLLEDFGLMIKDGSPVEPERLLAVSEKIIKQVQRANTIVKTINRFSHSVDKSVKRIDLGETLAFMAELSARIAERRGVTLKPELPATQVKITTSPFFLENLVWLCLDFAMNVTGVGKTVRLAVKQTENGALVKFTRLEAFAELQDDTFPAEQENALLGSLGAKLTADPDGGEIIITLPESIAEAA